MDLKNIDKKLSEIRKSKKRNFTQTFDLIINLKNLDIKNPKDKVEFVVNLTTNLKPKKLKLFAIVDQSIVDAKNFFDEVISQKDLELLSETPKKIRQIAHKFDKFIVQANFMQNFARIFGKILGSLNKMPTPKLGMIITPKSDLKSLRERLDKSALCQTKKNLVIQIPVGSEKESDEAISKNIEIVYNTLLQNLPKGLNNIKNFGVKLTMGKLIQI